MSYVEMMNSVFFELIIFWLMGSFASRTWADVGITLLFTIITFFVAIVLGWQPHVQWANRWVPEWVALENWLGQSTL